MNRLNGFAPVLSRACLAIALFGCKPCSEPREVVILGINDVYRIEGVEHGLQGGMARIRALRRQLEQESPDLLLLHAGDFLFPSLLSDWSGGAHMIRAMNTLDGIGNGFDSRLLVVFGNHEFDKAKKQDATNLQKQIQASEFDWINSNLRFSKEDGTSLVRAKTLKTSVIRESGGVRVGIFGLVTDAKPASKIDYIDEFLEPVDVARIQSLELRERGAELVVGLTHLPLETDRKILETLGAEGPDLIIGGHEHQRHHVEIDGRWIVKADADARTASVVRVRMREFGPSISVGYRFLNEVGMQPDPRMQSKIARILEEHESWFCARIREPFGCLERPVGKTNVPLIAEELEIRRYETNLGDWIADQIRSAFDDADIAFVNAGSLRLNQNIPSGPITRRNFEELLPYNDTLVELTLDPQQLRQVLERATEDWSGGGHWLQISGFAFEHDPNRRDRERVGRIQLVHDGKPAPIPEDRTLRVVTNKYLCEGNDGFELLKKIPCDAHEINLKRYLLKRLKDRARAISPVPDGRICNIPERGQRPCIFHFEDASGVDRAS